ncbi:MAG TPA: cytochrome c3 family protein [bacterium]|nr:cytochrome c3 family protein [bacterium]
MIVRYWKPLAVLVLAVMIAMSIGHGLAQSSRLTRDRIDIKTPGKKSGGQPTRVEFQHARHVSEFNATCESCHPPLATRVDDPANNQQNVHATCRECHAKNKPGKSFTCAKCHIR